MLQRKIIIEDALYTSPKVPNYRGNPLIEALPELPTFASLANAFEHLPATPTAANRKEDEWVRYQAVRNLRDIIVATPEHARAAIQLHSLFRDVYLARNPLDQTEEIRCIAIANRKLDEKLKLPFDWKSTASGHMFISSTGTGKTTFVDAFLLRLPQVIRHREYRGTPLGRIQILYLKISIPPDGTLKAFCLKFFKAVDDILGTNYVAQANAAETIPKMTLLMGKVATTISLGALIVDEFQNLKFIRTELCMVILNMFVGLVEEYGIAVVTICTPALERHLSKHLAIARKLTDNRTTFPIMSAGSTQWEHFTKAVWPYSYTPQSTQITKEIQVAWHRASGGNAAFAIGAYKRAQELAIYADSSVDEVTFEMVLNTEFAAFKAAIDALASGRIDELEAFEDLISFPASRVEVERFIPHANSSEDIVGGIENTPAPEGGDGGDFADLEAPPKPKKVRDAREQRKPRSAPVKSPLPKRAVGKDKG